MATNQASSKSEAATTGGLDADALESLLNLLELANSELTTFTGMESLPVTELLRDTLLDLLSSSRPDLFAHSQRVGWLCYGLGRQLGWSSKRTITLTMAGLLHELGTLSDNSRMPFWELVSTPEEAATRRIGIDLLEACHADSDLLEILKLAENFEFRNDQPEETPPHVIEGAAAFTFAHLFDSARFLPGAERKLPELLAAIKTIADSELEQRVVDGLEEWLKGADPAVESFDLKILQPEGLIEDLETVQVVRETFIDILRTLGSLQNSFDSFFMLDSTGRFQLWSSGCERLLGRTVREMRNKHWTNSVMGYCNEEGLAFSDSQTPLYQTLETGKPASTTLYLQDVNENVFEVHVSAVPLLGRDRLLQGIVEVHRTTEPKSSDSVESIFTPSWINDLAGELSEQARENPEENALPEIQESLVFDLESRLGLTDDMISPPPAPETSPEEEESPASHEPAELEASTSSEEVTESADFALEEQASDIVKETETPFESIEEETTVSEESSVSQELDLVADDVQKDSVQQGESPQEDLDDLLHRFDQLVTDVQEEITEEEEPAAAGSEDSATVSLEQPEEVTETLPEQEEPEPDVATRTQDEEVDQEEKSPPIAGLEQQEEQEQPAVTEKDSSEVEQADSTESAEESQPEAEEQAAEIENNHEPQSAKRDEDELSDATFESLPNIVPPESMDETVISSPAAGTDQTEERTDETVIEQSSPETEEEGVPVPKLPVDAREDLTSVDPGQTDPMAQPVKREEWDAFVTAFLEKPDESGERVSVLFLDIDRFKAINEGFGTRIGDDLIKEIARRLSQACGKRELSCRYGGEQYAIACPGLDLKQAYKRAEQFRKLIEKTRFDVLPFQSITTSIGVTTSEAEDTLDDLLNRAEFALSRAKHHGRNCSIGLDSEELSKKSDPEAPLPTVSQKPFEIEAQFDAMIASDMIVYKLGGFLYDMHAKVLEVDRKHVRMRVGTKGLLPYWGRKDEARPVLIDLYLGENWDQAKNKKGALAATTLHVKITPDGWVKNEEAFHTRAHHVLRELKAHFVST